MTSMADRDPHGIGASVERGVAEAVIQERARCVLDACHFCRGAEGSGFARRPVHGEVWPEAGRLIHIHSPGPRSPMVCRASEIYQRHIAEGGDIAQLLPPEVC